MSAVCEEHGGSWESQVISCRELVLPALLPVQALTSRKTKNYNQTVLLYWQGHVLLQHSCYVH